MTNAQNTSQLDALVKLKLDVIKFHNGDDTDYLQKGIARDACYTSFNSLNYKKKQMADAITDYETAVRENRDASQMRILSLIERMEVELEHLEIRHKADLAVYIEINDGEIWEPQEKKRRPKFKPEAIEALKKRVAA